MQYIIKRFGLLSFCILLLGSSACRSKKETVETDTKNNSIIDLKKEGYVKGTVKTYNVDGCTFMIFLEDNTKLHPINLEEEFRKDNYIVWIKYKERKEVNTVCMAGTVVEITNIISGEK